VSPGGHELSSEFLAQHQRERIFRGLAEAVTERGYAETTVADIVKHARVARNTFYANFSSKQDCFLATFEFASGELISELSQAGEGAAGVPDRVRAGVDAFLAYVESEPAFAHLILIDVLSAGPEAMSGFEESVAAAARLLRPARELTGTTTPLPDATEETIIGGVVWIVSQRLGAKPKKLTGLAPELVEFMLTPYLGPVKAREAAYSD